MSESVRSERVLVIDDVEPIRVAGGLYRPLRYLLGVRAFGINAYTACEAGDQLIEEHNENGVGSGRQEELYIVVTGGARFRVDGDEIDAPAGAVVFVAETAAIRSAVATEPHTTVVVVGGPADRPLPVSPFEFWFRAEAPYQRGDYREAIEIVAEGLEQWPDHPIIHYQLACYYALANDREQALDHLTRAIAEDESLRQQAIIDSDFASLNGSTAFIGLTTQ